MHLRIGGSPSLLSFSLYLTVLASLRSYTLQICLSTRLHLEVGWLCEMCTIRENVFKLRANVSHSCRNAEVELRQWPRRRSLENADFIALFLRRARTHAFVGSLDSTRATSEYSRNVFINFETSDKMALASFEFSRQMQFASCMSKVLQVELTVCNCLTKCKLRKP